MRLSESIMGKSGGLQWRATSPGSPATQETASNNKERDFGHSRSIRYRWPRGSRNEFLFRVVTVAWVAVSVLLLWLAVEPR